MRYTKENYEKTKESYYLFSNYLYENTSNEKKKIFFGKNKKYIQKNIPTSKIRYCKNNENNSIKKNKSCPKLNCIEQNTLNDKIDNNNYIYSDLYIDSYNDSYSCENRNNQLNNINLTKGRYILDNSFNSQRSDYISKNPGFNYEFNNNIFTRIVPKFENNDINRINPKKSDYIYYKNIINSKQQTSVNNSNYINEPIYNIYDTKNDSSSSNMSENSKRYIELIGNKSDLDKENKNGYIELLTLKDIKNIKKLNKLKEFKELNIPNNQKHILIQTLSSINNSFSSISNSNKNYENNNTIKYYPRKNNFLNDQKKEGKQNNRMTLSKITKKNRGNKSYNCIVFKEKNGLNRKKKNKNKRRNKTHDILQGDKEDRNGTPIKKEDDKGGKVILFKNNLINYNRNIKLTKSEQDEKESKSCNEYNYIYKNISKVTRIQKWWKKITYKIFIKKVIIIQKILRSYFFRKNQNKNFEDNYIYKRPKNKILFIAKENKFPYDKIIFIQKALRKYFIATYFNKSLFNSYKRPKNFCEIITKKRFIKKKNNNIVKNQISKEELINAKYSKNKKHHYTKSKLSPITINKILLNESEIKYETNNYTYFKKCDFRKPCFEEIEDDNKENKRPLTCEIMRKINFKWNKRSLTPEIKRNNININYSLKIIRLINIQYKNIIKNRNENKKLKNSLDKSKYNKYSKNIDNLYRNNKNYNKLKKDSGEYNQNYIKKINGDNNYKNNLIKINETNIINTNVNKNNDNDFSGQKTYNINNNFNSSNKSCGIYMDEKYTNKNAGSFKSNNIYPNILNTNLNFSFNTRKKNDIIHINNLNDVKIKYNSRNYFNNMKNGQKSNDSMNNIYYENNINFINNKNDNFNNQYICNYNTKINENKSFNIHSKRNVKSINESKVSIYKIDNNKNINEYENKINLNDNQKKILEINKINYINILDSKNSSFQDSNIQNEYNNNFIYTSNSNSKRNYKSDTGRIELRENKWDKNSFKSSELNL